MTDYAIDTAIRSQLAAGTALIAGLGGTLIFQDIAPDNQTYPYIVFSLQAGAEDTTSANKIELPLYYVRVYDDNILTASTLYGLAHTQLQEQSFAITGYSNLWCRREQRISNVEITVDGTKVYARGGYYRLICWES